MKKMNNVLFNNEPTVDELAKVENELCDEKECMIESGDDCVSDGLTMYLNSIGAYDLLSLEEEQELARVIREGGSDADEARNALVLANLRLVMFYAKRFVGRGVELEDLNTMGIEGLIRAAEKYDYSLGYKFSTYASWWIIQSMNRGIAEESQTVRIPVHTWECLGKILKAKKEYSIINGCEPSVEELCEMTELSQIKVERALKAMYTMCSLDASVADDSEATIGEFIRDEKAINPCESVIIDDLSEGIQKVLSMLDPKEARVLSLRNGIGCEEPMSLEQIAKLDEFKVSRERIRQIEQKAINRIKRTPSMRNLLEDYVA